MNTVLIVEDDPDIRSLIEAIFSMDSAFSVAALADTVEDALVIARTEKPDVIVLDDHLAGALTGLEAAPQLKQVAPATKIILFTAHAELRTRADEQPAVDAFLLKTESKRLLPLARGLTGLTPPVPSHL